MLKKIIIFIVVLIFGIFLFFYQLPIIGESEAVSIALETLENPPSGWEIDNSNLENIQKESIEVVLADRLYGFWNKLLNRKQWQVSVNTENIGTTVYLNAYNGSFLDIQGQFN